MHRIALLALLLLIEVLLGLPAIAQNSDVMAAQERLESLGYDPGPTDGIMGGRTRDAILDFQRANEMPTTGTLDVETRAALFAESPADTETSFSAEEQTADPEIAAEESVAGLENVDDDGSANATEDRVTASGTQWGEQGRAREGASTLSEVALLGILLGVLLIGAMVVALLRKRRRQGETAVHAETAPRVSETVTSVRRHRDASASQDTRHPGSVLAQPAKTEPPRRPPPRPETGWIPSSGRASIAGRDIGGMVYLGRAPTVGQFGERDHAFIDPALKVSARERDPAGGGMLYWPSYGQIQPVNRASYLDWLASGRSDPDYGVGYVFLYFYGLERRVFLDHAPESETREIMDEVRRLLGIYGANRSVSRYLNVFLEAAALWIGGQDRPTPVLEHSGYEMPVSVRLEIGRQLQAGQSIGADWALSWLVTHPETRLRTPARRVFHEFAALFAFRFLDRYPEGLQLKAPKRNLKLDYQAASGAFQVDLTERIGPVPDIMHLRKPLTVLQTLADEVTDELDKFSRFIGRNPDGRGSLEAHLLLPAPLKGFFPSEELEALTGWARDRIAAGGLVPVADVVERIEGVRPQKIGKRQLSSVADALARLAVGLAPDPRFALRGPTINEPVMLFALPSPVEKLEKVTTAYRAVLVALVLGVHIAQADGTVCESERETLAARIDAADHLADDERIRLHANLHWLLAVPPSLSEFRRHLKDLAPETKASLGRLSAAIAASDGRIAPEEVATLEKLYRTLGLDPDLLHGHLHALMASDEPVTLSVPGGEAPVHAIPPDPRREMPPEKRQEGLQLDQARIAAVMKDTAGVASFLDQIFGDDEPDEPEDEPHAATVEERRFEGLDAAHARLVGRLLDAPHWTGEAFAALAEEGGLMPAGALETINEWAYDRFDEALLEEDEGIELNMEVAGQLIAEGEVYERA